MPMASHRIVVMALAAGCLGAAIALAGDPPARPSEVAPPETFGADALDHWAYQPVKRTPPPAVKEQAWVRNPIDRFILAGLEEMGFRHAPEADRPALIRRVTYDLTGLPPTPAEVDAFLTDPRPDAYERLVDRLLEQPPSRRAVGAALARPGALCRLQRLRARRRAARRLAIPRLGRPHAQRRSALRPVPLAPACRG